MSHVTERVLNRDRRCKWNTQLREAESNWAREVRADEFISTEVLEKSLVDALLAEQDRLLELRPRTEWRELEARFIGDLLERHGYVPKRTSHTKVTVSELRFAAQVLNLPDIVRILSFEFRANQLREFGKAGLLESDSIEEVVSRNLVGSNHQS